MYWVSFNVDGNYSCVTFIRKVDRDKFLANLLAVFDGGKKCVIKSWSNTTREDVYVCEST